MLRRGWAWIVHNSRVSPVFFFTFATLCFVGSVGLGELVMRTAAPNEEELRKELLKNHSGLMMSKVNKERLAQYLGEIQRKENTEDRYVAALRGETLTGTPGARIRGGGGTSLNTYVPDGSTSSPDSSVNGKQQ